MMQRAVLALLLALVLGPACAHAQAKTAKDDTEKKDLERMAQQHQHDKPSATEAATTPPAREVTGQEVVYGEVGGKPLHGFLARPARPKDAKGPLPALIVIHEWWGLNDNIRQVTKRLAGEGYTALAVDLYGGGVADSPDKATELMKAAMANKPAAEENLRKAYSYLETQQKAPKIGSIGWCFGGGWSLNTALQFPDKLDATVIYYGHLETDRDQLAKLRMPILGFFGAEDQGIPAAGVREFEKTMKGLGKDVEVQIYDGAGHAFANPSGTAYRPEAARDAWDRTTKFLAKNLKGGS
jgi:carboxymethylenebutenolidase